MVMTFDRRRVISGAMIAGVAVGTQRRIALGQDREPAPIILTLKAEIGPRTPTNPSMLERIAQVIRNRAELIPGVGVTVTTAGDTQILVELSGVTDRAGVIATITQRGWVELIDPVGVFLEAGVVVATSSSPTPWALPDGKAVEATPTPVYETIITSEDIIEVYTYTDQNEIHAIGFRLNPRAADAFGSFTSAHINQPMSVLVDNVVVNTPVIMSEIRDSGIIQGLSEAETNALAIQLAVAPLPARVEIVSVE